MKEIILNKVRKTPNYKKFIALVDDEDYERVNQFNWYAKKQENLFYAIRHIERHKIIFMHNIIVGFKGVDHIDGNGLNNQRNNLRKATQQQNMMNKQSRKNSSSRFKGIYWYKQTKRWMARITFNQRIFYLGYFTSEIQAALAYNKKALELFGEFAKLNII